MRAAHGVADPPKGPPRPRRPRRSLSAAATLVRWLGSWKEAGGGSDPAARRASSDAAVDGCLLPARAACKYGAACYRASAEHLARFVHPGDRGYRQGLLFEDCQKPELETLWQVFTFFDPRESGHLSQSAFELAARVVAERALWPVDLAGAWADAGGEELQRVSFVPFVAWAARVGSRLPTGLEVSPGALRRCRAQGATESEPCCCNAYVPASSSKEDPLCLCGHRECLHRSEAAEQSLGAQLVSGRPAHWKRGEIGLVEITDRSLLSEFQFLLDATHKESDNWTRDRGCSLHGVNGCAPPCMYQNRAPVPKGYRLVAVHRNQNPMLWARYRLMRAAVLQECAQSPCERAAVESSGPPFDALDGLPLMGEVNEWRLFHGSSLAACKAICQGNFRLSMAGSGGTWRERGASRGQPLYGQGIYMTERITKADEYARPHAIDNLCNVVLCRAVGGRARVCARDATDAEALRSQVLDGPEHSVLGDRVRELKKPYREMVIYDRDQVYPEYLLTYERIF